jgi:signal transduction histidine kinase
VTVRQEAATAVLQVSDGGPGFAEKDLPRLFQRFERASPLSYGGFGLGLYLARQIAEAHGGTISAANNQGPGASITVRLPLEAATSAKASAAAS